MRKPPPRTKQQKRTFKPREECLYLAFFKPYNVLSQFSAGEEHHQTLAEFGFPEDVYPVGRLDSDSEGLLVLSDDSRLNGALLDPENMHERTYWAQVENVPSDSALDELRRGVFIQGRKTRPCRVERLEDEPALPPRTVPIRFRKNIPTAWISLSITEGKNRQVRRMTAAVGHPTLRLVRWAIGAVTLGELQLEPGQWKELDRASVERLFK